MSAYSAFLSSTSSPASLPLKEPSSSTASHRKSIPNRMVETVMTLTVLALEEDLIPAQGAGDILYVYARDTEITHNVRRTLEVFDGDMHEAIVNIRTFVIDGILGDAPRS